MPDNCVAIIDEFIERRKAKGLTQRELAKEAKLTQPVIARLESKKVVPQLDTLLKVAAALGCDLAVIPIDQEGQKRIMDGGNCKTNLGLI